MCGLHTATDTTKVYNYMKQDTLTASEDIKKIIQQVGEGTLTETMISGCSEILTSLICPNWIGKRVLQIMEPFQEWLTCCKR